MATFLLFLQCNAYVKVKKGKIAINFYLFYKLDWYLYKAYSLRPLLQEIIKLNEFFRLCHKKILRSTAFIKLPRMHNRALKLVFKLKLKTLEGATSHHNALFDDATMNYAFNRGNKISHETKLIKLITKHSFYSFETNINESWAWRELYRKWNIPKKSLFSLADSVLYPYSIVYGIFVQKCIA